MKTRLRSALLAVATFFTLLFASPPVSAQGPGSLDTAFNTAASGGSAYLNAAVVLPDGKMIICGDFTTVGGTAHNNIARLNADGSVDSSFTASTNSAVSCVAVQADGKLVLGGGFTSVNGSTISTTTGVNCIARLNADGTRDTAFNTSGGIGLGGADNGVICVAVQTDGKLVLGGNFNVVNGTTGVSRIVRLNADGTRDTGFNTGLGGANSYVSCVAVQADGKLVLGGTFTSVNRSSVSTTTGVNRIARLNADGTRDEAFNAGLGGADNDVHSVAVQADGKLVLGGFFSSVNGSSVSTTTGVNCIARLNADGTRDTAFNTSGGIGLGGVGGMNRRVYSVAVQADGKLVLGGLFDRVNGSAVSNTGVNCIARLNADGTRDIAFNTNGGTGLGGALWTVHSVAVQADGKLVLGGLFDMVNGTLRGKLARLNNDTATESLTAPDVTQVLWSRSGAGPELSAATFEQSIDGGTTWSALGNGTRVGITSNWQLSGLNLPSTVRVRARGRTAGGVYSGSSGLIEQVASFTPTVTLSSANLPITTTTLTITGTNFDAVTPANNTVAFTPAGTGTVTDSTATSLTVTSISGLMPGALNAVVTTNAQNSGAAVQVATVDTAPTITDIVDQMINEDTNTVALAFTIGDVETAATALTMSGSSSNPTLVPNGNIVFSGSGANRTVTVTPAANQFGTATITVTVSDGTATASDVFLLSVNPVNDAPTLTGLTDLSTNEDTSTGAIAFTINDQETAAGSLTLTASSSNVALVPNANVVLGGSGASRTVTITPLANQFGSTTITITVGDGVLSTISTFLLTVASVNDAPTISDITNRTINEDATTGALAFTIGDVETAATSLTVTRSSSNTALVPTANIVLSGSGANRTVTVTPAANQFGTATITVTVSDGAASTSDTFLLTVVSVNDAPTITDITDRTINEDASTGAIAFTIGDVETATTSLTVTRSSSNTTLVPTANIVLGGSGANRTVTVTPAANQFGTATITVTVSDGTASTNDTFLLTVNAVNDAPTLTDITDQSISVNSLTNSLPFTVGDVETAAATLTVSGTSSNQTLVADGNIFFGGSGASRTVTVIPESNQVGSTIITVTVSDGALTGSDTFVLNVVAPEIAVEQPFNSNLADGGTKSFGNVAVGANSSLTFFIKNTGSANLTGLTITQDGSDAGLFTVTANPTAPVSGPNGNTSFTVRFAPTSTGLKTAAIHIASNDLDENPFDLTLTGTGVIPMTGWRQQYFGSTVNSGDGADLNDYDHDGLPNIIEYAFGLNPTLSSSGQPPQAQFTGGNFGISFTEPAGVTGITYGAEWSTTLAANDWHAIPDSDTAPQHTFSVPTGGNTGLFIRLKVTSP